MIRTLVDTGPLVAYCNRADRHHAWAKETFGQIAPPLWTCEAVLTEAFYRVQKDGGRLGPLWDWLRRGAVRVEFHMAAHWEDLARLMDKYADQKMDLADACLVKLSELHHDCRVVTCDADFLVYRRKERLQIPLIFPPRTR
jgi:predicted nucleic acid-binding protein